MKKRNWPYVLLIIVCLAIFCVYWVIARIRDDHTAPKIIVEEGLLQVSVQNSESVLLQGVTARDNRDGDVTTSLLVESVRLLDTDGNATATYAAFDKAGNVAKAQRQIRFTDYESPKFTLNTPLVFTQGSNFDVLNVIGAQDMVDGDIQHRIRATSLDETSIATLGTHQVQFRVTNSLGDMVERIFPVEVYSAGTYDASLTLTDYLIYMPVGATFVAESYLNTFTLNREATSLTEGLPAGFTLTTSGFVDTQTPGVYALSYTVTYSQESAGYSQSARQYTGYSKLIVVVEG